MEVFAYALYLQPELAVGLTSPFSQFITYVLHRLLNLVYIIQQIVEFISVMIVGFDD